MGKQYPYLSIWDHNTVAILHILELEPFLLFCDHQGTNSESREIEMSIYQPILNHKNISKPLWDKNRHILQDERKILWQLFILTELDPFFTIL